MGRTSNVQPGDAEQLQRDRNDQRRKAWERSAAVRAENKLVRGMMKRKQLDPYAVIAGSLELDDPAVAKQIETIVTRWRLDALLRAVPGIGPSRKQEVLAIFRASPRQRLGALTFERRKQLADLTRAAVEIS